MPQAKRVTFYTYILACASNTAIYVGVTSDLHRRVQQHASGRGGSHTARYRIHKLVHFEEFETLPEAIHRERQLKRWRRAWKNALIERHNPHWSDLTMELSFR